MQRKGASAADDEWETVATTDSGDATSASVAKGQSAETVVFRLKARNSAGWSDPSDPSVNILCEASMQGFTLLVRSTLFPDKRKIIVNAGSINHLNVELSSKLQVAQAFHLYTDDGVLLTSLDQLRSKDKVELRPDAADDGAGGAKRNFKLLVTSPLFADKRKCQVSAGSVEELVAGVRTKLEIEQDIVIVIYDEDFEEHRQVCDLDDIEKDTAKITVELKQ
eukprot:SAG11_NODE_2785_length_2975_cov_1.465229_1_plen_222_part_00